MNFYGHVTERMQRETTAGMDGILRGSSAV